LDQIVSDLSLVDNTTITQNFVLTPTAGLSVETDLFTTTLALSGVGEGTLRINNIGNATLEFTVTEQDGGFTPSGQVVSQVAFDSVAADIPWLEVAPMDGSVSPQDFQDLSLTFTAPLVDTGVYSGSLSIQGNDPGNPQEVVVVRMIVTEAGIISGTVRLQGRTDHSGAVVTALGAVTSIAESVSDAAGNYALSVPEGSLDIVVEMERYLDSENTGVFVVPGSGITLSDLDLKGGDANDDDIINILDLSFLGARYGTSFGEPGWDDEADINNDLTVNIQDIVLAGSNFKATSPVDWHQNVPFTGSEPLQNVQELNLTITTLPPLQLLGGNVGYKGMFGVYNRRNWAYRSRTVLARTTVIGEMAH
jgi:hypothetical protein